MKQCDIVIVGSGVSGLYCALQLPRDKKIMLLTKDQADKSDSFLAQGGICVLRDEEDYDSFFEDTMRAGHYENDPRAVEIMIRESRKVIEDLVDCGTQFERDGKDFLYTKEGAHSRARILYHKDVTGKEITSHLLSAVRARENVTIVENFTVVDLLVKEGVCYGVLGQDGEGEYRQICADYTVLATGGIGGLYAHSTNYRHLTGDSIAFAVKHGIRLKDIDYVQIHPTTLYTKGSGREFLISESVRGEGAVLLDGKGNRFTDELQPRDVVAKAIFDQMKKENSDFVRLSLLPIPKEKILTHFPNIYKRCLEEGYDVTQEPIPVVPSQHYFMGGIAVDGDSATSMPRLYAVGETACNGVHGKNRLASNSLLESLVFAGRAARHIAASYSSPRFPRFSIDKNEYSEYKKRYKEIVLKAIREGKEHE